MYILTVQAAVLFGKYVRASMPFELYLYIRYIWLQDQYLRHMDGYVHRVLGSK